MTEYILAKRHLPSLVAFALSNVLLVFDYDGTLAPIAETPAGARMRPTTRRLLARVSRNYPSVVISGRAMTDIRRRLRGIPLWAVSGNHGFEPWSSTPDHASRVHGWVTQLNDHLSGHPGIVVEDKRYSVTIHYRRSSDRRRARAVIDEAIVDVRGARILGGKLAVNLIPRGAPHKGVALERARRLLACDTSIYVGDDDTDEDAFGAAPRDRLLAIRVGPTRRTRAAYHLKNQGEIDTLLQTLISLRSGQRSRNPGLASAGYSQ